MKKNMTVTELKETIKELVSRIIDNLENKYYDELYAELVEICESDEYEDYYAYIIEIVFAINNAHSDVDSLYVQDNYGCWEVFNDAEYEQFYRQLEDDINAVLNENWE